MVDTGMSLSLFAEPGCCYIFSFSIKSKPLKNFALEKSRICVEMGLLCINGGYEAEEDQLRI
jgi:hypothetical protein